MGIRFSCPNGHRLHVKEYLAGKRGICPSCGAKFVIPGASESAESAVGPVAAGNNGAKAESANAGSAMPSVVIAVADAPFASTPNLPAAQRLTGPAPSATISIGQIAAGANTTSAAAEAAPELEPQPLVDTTAERSVSPVVKYISRRERARRNRTRVAILLFVVVIALAVVLIWILRVGPGALGGGRFAPAMDALTHRTPSEAAVLH